MRIEVRKRDGGVTLFSTIMEDGDGSYQCVHSEIFIGYETAEKLAKDMQRLIYTRPHSGKAKVEPSLRSSFCTTRDERLELRIPSNLKADLKDFAQESRISVSDVVNLAIEQYLANAEELK